ncbi:hypothetical protein MZJ48_004543 [Vibrio parahaemolyticus]|nr:hypothetical protein [Vibrio parahaemolyticus]
MTKLWAILVTLLLSLNVSANECIFDSHPMQTEKFNLENVQYYDLDSNNSEVKGILSNGNLFSVKYWSCNSFGVQATLFVGPFNIDKNVSLYIDQIARLVLDTVDYTRISEILLARSFILTERTVNVSLSDDNSNEEFYFSYGTYGDFLIIEIRKIIN